MYDMRKTTLLSGFKGIDIWLLVSVVVLCIVGAVFIYSGVEIQKNATLEKIDSTFFKHLACLGIGSLALIFGTIVDSSTYRKFYRPIFITSAILLLLVLIVGKGDHGATRWISLGGFQFQPSEVMKFALCSFLAFRLSTFKTNADLVKTALFTVAVLLLVLLQPNYSMFGFLCGLCFVLLVCAKFPWKYLILIFVAAAIAGVALGFSSEYRVKRIVSLIHPEEHVSGGAFQQQNMVISVGSGGLFGKGIGKGVQKRRVTYVYSDGIFALVAEEGGFFTVSLVMLCYLCILWRGYKIAVSSNSKYACYMASGLSSLIFMNALVHIAVCIGKAPATGQPLPFISYGGTSLVVNMFFVGVLLNISKERTGSYFKFEETSSKFDELGCVHPTSRFGHV